MTARQCIRCGHWWSFNTGRAEFKAITKWCPSCIAIVLPIGFATVPVTAGMTA